MQSLDYNLGESKVLLRKMVCNFFDIFLDNVELSNVALDVKIRYLDRFGDCDPADKSFDKFMLDEELPYNNFSNLSNLESFRKNLDVYIYPKDNTKALFLESLKDLKIGKYRYISHIVFDIYNLSIEQAKQVKYNYDKYGKPNFVV